MLPKPHRIPSNEISRVLRQGKRIVASDIEAKVLKTATHEFRCAIVVPLRVDKRATARNRVRRLVSESVRRLLPRLSVGYDAMILIQRRLPDTQADVDRRISQLLNPFIVSS